MTNWKHKLAAYLHDPPHKPFRIAGHEDARGPMLRHVGLSEEEIDAWHRQPDWWAAAADRFPFPRAEICFVDWKTDGGLEFRHPLCGSRLVPPNQPRVRSATAESWLEDAMRGLPVGDAGWREKFFRLWRLWPERAAREKNPLLAYLVADTRIPDHTLWHHNGLVSALEATGGRSAFLLFQVGPVQDFIAQARKTQDLWSASYLLSFLISKALASVALRLGPDAIIYPSLRGVPLMDWWWRQEDGLFPPDFFTLGQGRLHRNELLTPSLPNRFLALVPGGEAGRSIAREAETAVRDLWREIAEAVHADICLKLQEPLAMDEFPGWDTHWKNQAARFPIVDWVVHDWQPEAEALRQADEEKSPPLSGGWSGHSLRHADAWREMIPLPHRESWHGNRNDAFAWALHYAATDWKFAAAKNARGFAPWPALEPGASAPPKDHLNGRDEVLGGANPDGFWAVLRAAYDGADRGDFKGSQLYGAISIIKRLWPRVYLGKRLQWQPCKPRFDSVQEIAAIEHDLDALPTEAIQSCGYYAVLAMDGDDMGQWVAGNKTPVLEKSLAAKAWNYFKLGKDGQGGWKPDGAPGDLPANAEFVHRPLSPSFHAALSEALSNFGLYCAGQVVKAFGGQLLYSGGDDVLAMLPAAKALDCALALQCAFRGELPLDCTTECRTKLEYHFEFLAPGFVVCKQAAGESEALRPNWPLMVPGTAATASVGIAIGHVRSPMQDTIQAAREAEQAAKNVPGKGAFCLSILKRSGEAGQFAAQFKTGVGAVWAELGSGVLGQSGRFAYRYLQLIRPLLASTAKGNDNGWEPEWTDDLKQAVEAELRHVLKQQANQDGAAAQSNSSRWIGALIGADWHAPALSPRAFVHFWMVWAFVKRLTEQTGDDQ